MSFFFIAQIVGQDDLNFGEEVARRSVLGPDAVAFDAETRAAGGARRDGQADGSLRRGDVDFGAERRFGERDGDANFEPVADAAKVRMRADVDRDEDVAGGRAVFTGLALAAEANFLYRRRCRPGF